MCRQLEISRAAYYKWLYRNVSEAEHENMKLAGLIKEYDERFNYILGYRKKIVFPHCKKRIYLFMQTVCSHWSIKIFKTLWRKLKSYKFIGVLGSVGSSGCYPLYFCGKWREGVV